MQITSTLWGMEQYFNYKDQSLFESIKLPMGVNKDTLVDTILVESGEFEVIYNNGDFLKKAINVWFDRKYKMLERWVTAINIDYEPLENYNRTERWTDKAAGETSNTGSRNATTSNTDTRNSTTSNNGTRNSTTTGSGSDSGTDKESGSIDNTTTGSSTIGNQSNSDETQVSAFNTSAYSPSERVTSNIGGKTDTTSGTDKTTAKNTLTKSNTFSNEGTAKDTTTNTGTLEDTTASNGTATESTEDNGTSKNDSEHEGHMFGNIGVTTSQQMLKEEMTLWATIDIYKETAEMFVQDFCIMIY